MHNDYKVLHGKSFSSVLRNQDNCLCQLVLLTSYMVMSIYAESLVWVGPLGCFQQEVLTQRSHMFVKMAILEYNLGGGYQAE